jgi:hypothetical protein
MMPLAVILHRGAGRLPQVPERFPAGMWGQDVRPLCRGVTALHPVARSVAPSGDPVHGDRPAGSTAVLDRQGSGRPTEGGGGPWM